MTGDRNSDAAMRNDHRRLVRRSGTPGVGHRPDSTHDLTSHSCDRNLPGPHQDLRTDQPGRCPGCSRGRRRPAGLHLLREVAALRRCPTPSPQIIAAAIRDTLSPCHVSRLTPHRRRLRQPQPGAGRQDAGLLRPGPGPVARRGSAGAAGGAARPGLQGAAAARRREAASQAERFARFGPAGGPDLLVDAYHPTLRGGAGQTGDWSLAASLASQHRLLLAGGLTPDNVARPSPRCIPGAWTWPAASRPRPAARTTTACAPSWRQRSDW